MATLGEHGTSDPENWPPRRLAELRHTELRNSLAASTSTNPVLGYEDGTLARRDDTDAVARHIEAIDPDIIVTFGPDGLTGHPDHRAISRWTTDAWLAKTGSRTDLWYATVTPEFHRTWGPTNERVGFWADQPEPPCTDPGPTWPTAPGQRGHRVDLKVAALRGPHLADDDARQALLGREGLPGVVAHRVVPAALPRRPRDRNHTLTSA